MEPKIHEILVYRTVKQMAVVQVYTDYQPGEDEFTDLVHEKTFDLEENEWEDLLIKEVEMVEGLGVSTLIS